MFPQSIVTAAKRHPLAAITASRIATEICSATVFLGAAHLVDHQTALKPVKKAFAHALTPVLPQLDSLADSFPALETDKETALRHAAAPKDRAYIYADAFIDNGIRTGLSIAAQAVLMRFFDHQLGMKLSESGKGGISNPYLSAAIWDHTVQLGSALTLNTMLTRPNEEVQRNLERILEKTGVAKEDAACIARDGMAMVLPNIAGALAGIASLYHSHGQQTRT